MRISLIVLALLAACSRQPADLHVGSATEAGTTLTPAEWAAATADNPFKVELMSSRTPALAAAAAEVAEAAAAAEAAALQIRR